jgi:hypothetical protein
MMLIQRAMARGKFNADTFKADTFKNEKRARRCRIQSKGWTYCRVRLPNGNDEYFISGA